MTKSFIVTPSFRGLLVAAKMHQVFWISWEMMVGASVHDVAHQLL